jgi:hypothetical protein
MINILKKQDVSEVGSLSSGNTAPNLLNPLK